MDWEAPADAWFVWIAVTIISFAVAGLVIGLPSGPPPDANQAANSIERVAGSSVDASSTYESDADRITIDGSMLELENEHGTAHASLPYGAVVPVTGDDRLENLTHGSSFETEYAEEQADPNTDAVAVLMSEIDTAYDANSGRNVTTTGEITTRSISVDPDVDEIEDTTETITVNVTEGDDVYENAYVEEVTLFYDGVPDRTVEFELDGEYTSGFGFTETETETFQSGSGTIEVTTVQSLVFPADPPLDYTVDVDDGSWAGEPVDDETTAGELDISQNGTWTNEIERGSAIDADDPFVEHDSETDRYLVTLVAV